MSETACCFYADEQTQAHLTQPARRVLLVGGYGGFPNFGDILQLKGALEWHRSNSLLEPIILCHAGAVPDGSFPQRVRGWFGEADVIFWTPADLDMSQVGLSPFNPKRQIAHLHLYGGGILNRFWGRGTLDVVEGLINTFGVTHYVLSGQQIDEQFVPSLREHFARNRPRLAGGRDLESVRLLNECGVDAADSFDDAIQPLQEWTASDNSTSRDSFDVLIHLNMSYYTGQSERAGLIQDLSLLAEHLGEQVSGPPRVGLLSAYADSRVDEVVDSLGALLQLEEFFPFRRFEVIQLGQMALELPLNGRTSERFAPSARFAFSCSYHVSLWASLLGIPCYLRAHNDYYQQKRNGLNTQQDLKDFLKNPRAISLESRLAARSTWLTRLAEVYRQPAPTREPAALPGSFRNDQRFVPKGGLATFAQLKADLQTVRASWADQKKIIDSKQDYIGKLEAEFNRIWSELKALGEDWETKQRLLQERQEAIARLEEERDALLGQVQQPGQPLPD